MRIEATLPDPRGNALLKLAEELGLTRSQLVDEALALFMKAVLEVRRGRKLVTIDPSQGDAVCELATPTLTTLEWAAMPASVSVSERELDRMTELAREPGEPSEGLKGAAAEHRRRVADRAAARRPPSR